MSEIPESCPAEQCCRGVTPMPRTKKQIHAKTLAFRTPGAKLVAVSDIFEEAGARVVEGCNGLPKYYKVGPVVYEYEGNHASERDPGIRTFCLD